MEFTKYDTRVAGYAVIVDPADRVLLSWWNGESMPERAAWSLPGGGIEFDEAVEDGVVREVYEETGYRVELTGFLGTSAFIVPDREPRPFKGLRLIYTARITGGTLGTVEVGGSTARAEWVPLADLDAVTHADVVEVGVQLWRAAGTA